MGTDPDLIAVMRPERSGAADVTRTDLLGMVAELPGARRIGETAFAFDTGLGSNVAVHVGDVRVEFRWAEPGERPRVKHGPDDDPVDPEDAHDDEAAVAQALVEELAVSLQTRTRWALEDCSTGARYVAGDPCPRCATLHFEWENACIRCGATLASPGATPEQLDADDVDAQLVVARLLQLGWIELGPGMARRRIENALAAALANSSRAPDDLHRVLVDHPSVGELYCGVEDLARIVTAIREREKV